MSWVVNFTPRLLCTRYPLNRRQDGHPSRFKLLIMTQQPPVGQGLPIIEVPRSHSDTQHSAGPLWTRDQPDADTTHNTHKRKTSMPPAGFEPAFSASKRSQNHALDRAATGISWSGSFGKRKSVFETRMRNPDRPSRSLLHYRLCQAGCSFLTLV